MNGVDDLGGILARTLSFVATTITPYGGAPSQQIIYHGAGTPPDWCCDYIAVWEERLYRYQTFPVEANTIGVCDLPLAANIAIKVRRPCWPTPSGSPPRFPDPDETTAMALALTRAKVALMCALIADLAAGRDSEVLGSTLGADLPAHRVSAAIPSPSLKGCAGWVQRFTLDLGECCMQ